VPIPDDEVAQVRAATDIVALIGEHVALRQQGRRWVGRCPFHAERTPSFNVNPEAGLYYCFGCQASGDAISFVRATEHLDFVDAVRLLADRAGVVLHDDAEGGGRRRARGELLEAIERAVQWYHERLLSAPEAGRARDYLRSRGYDRSTVRMFRLGWAPDEWDALSRSLQVSDRVFTNSGLGFINRRGRQQDAFRARIIFPIFDPAGRPIALGGRILPEQVEGAQRPGAPDRPSVGPADRDASRAQRGRDDGAVRRVEPKYKNSPETAIYSKRRTLYGLNWAKHDVIATGEVVVCEGYTDVIGCFRSGVPRAVATCGTALGEEHFTLLRNFAKRIVLAYDADSAGQAAMTRIYEWERRHEVDIAVAELPAGADPAALAERDPEALRLAIAHARPYLQFRIDRIFATAQLTTAEGRAKAADQAIAAIAEHPDVLVRDQYAMAVSDRCRIDPLWVRQRLEALRRRTSRAEAPKRASSRRSGDGDEARLADRSSRPIEPSVRPGLEALRLAVHCPEAFAAGLEAFVDVDAEAGAADELAEALFADPLQREAFRSLLSAADLHGAIEGAPPGAADLLARIAVEEPVVGKDDLADPVDAVLVQLLRAQARRALVDLERAARVSPQEFRDRAVEAAQVQRWLAHLEDPSDGSDARGRLLAWLLGKRQEV